MALHANPKISFSGSPYMYLRGLWFYTGDITVTVSGDFGYASIECLNHGWMGGQNLLHYSSECDQQGGEGDPHVTNIKGEHFEVAQLGQHTLLHVPRLAPAQQTLLDVKITISACSHDLFNWQCKSRFIESMNIS